MPASTLKSLIALFLVAHGLVHYSLTTVPVPAPGALRTPFWPNGKRSNVDPLWPVSRLGLPAQVVRLIGWVLCLAALAGFALSGLGLIGLPGLSAIWQGMAIFAAAASLILLALYWHPWLVMGVAISLGVLASLWQHWPTTLFS